VAEREASQSEIRHVLGRFFSNSREQLLLSLLGDEEISPEEIQRMKDAIRDAAPDPDLPGADAEPSSSNPRRKA
jgi:predicted transcriptional regulator